jgi:hypothetical protein
VQGQENCAKRQGEPAPDRARLAPRLAHGIDLLKQNEYSQNKGKSRVAFFHKVDLRMIRKTNVFKNSSTKPSGQAMEVLATWQMIILS